MSFRCRLTPGPDRIVAGHFKEHNCRLKDRPLIFPGMQVPGKICFWFPVSRGQVRQQSSINLCQKYTNIG
jgi:hypothetical protein